MTPTLQDQKRAHLQLSVKRLKAEQGLSQRAIAERMDENEQELSGKLSDKSKRGITDEYMDRFGEEFNMPFTTEGREGAADAALREEIRLLKDSVNRLLSLHATLLEEQVKRERASHS